MKAKHKKMMNTVFRRTIMESKLKRLGFTYKMRIWSLGTFTITFYKYCWKCSVPGMKDSIEVVYMDQLYEKYWELTGLVLPKIQLDEE